MAGGVFFVIKKPVDVLSTGCIYWSESAIALQRYLLQPKQNILFHKKPSIPAKLLTHYPKVIGKRAACFVDQLLRYATDFVEISEFFNGKRLLQIFSWACVHG